MPFPTPQRAAESRIREKLASLPAKPREGLARIDRDLRAAGVAPGTRLHYVSAVLDLGRVAESTRPGRLARATPPTMRPVEHDFLGDFKD